MFERFLEAREESVQIGDIGETQVRAYVAYLQQEHKWDDADRCPTASRCSQMRHRLLGIRAAIAHVNTGQRGPSRCAFRAAVRYENLTDPL